MTDSPKVKIFLSYHKPSTLLKSEILTPIHVGRSLSHLSAEDKEWMLSNMIGDDTQDNISEKNPFFCELTAQYWAWNNCDADYIGFMHYRRHLNFNQDATYDENRWGVVENELLDSRYLESFHLDDEHIMQMTTANDIIVAKAWDVTNFRGSINNYIHYAQSSKELHIEDYDKALAILLEKYPEYKEAADSYNSDTLGYYTNIFILKRELFVEYSEWLFSILFELEKMVDISGYSTQEARIFGYISEWLFGIFVTHKKQTHRVLELQRTMINNTSFIQDNNHINICFSTDDNYVPHLAATIASIATNHKGTQPLDLYILHKGDITPKSIQGIKDLESLRSGINIEFIKIDIKEFEGLNTPKYGHITDATFYRYIIPTIFDKLDRIIYLDCDLVVVSDITELYNYDLKGKALGAVQDLIGIENQERLNLNKEKYHYCNAGVLVMDITKLRELGAKQRLIDFTLANISKLRYFDQDAINTVLEDEIAYLDLKWNLQYYKKGLAVDFNQASFESAIENPCIVHYIGKEKPWDNGNRRPFRDEYWKYLKMSKFHKKVKLRSLLPVKLLRLFFRIDHTDMKWRLRILSIPIYKVEFNKEGGADNIYLFGIRIK